MSPFACPNRYNTFNFDEFLFFVRAHHVRSSHGQRSRRYFWELLSWDDCWPDVEHLCRGHQSRRFLVPPDISRGSFRVPVIIARAHKVPGYLGQTRGRPAAWASIAHRLAPDSRRLCGIGYVQIISSIGGCPVIELSQVRC
jgi:hypothetical protein